MSCMMSPKEFVTCAHCEIPLFAPQKWKSNPMHWCDYCKVWMQDTPTAKSTHERGMKHKENVARSKAQTHALSILPGTLGDRGMRCSEPTHGINVQSCGRCGSRQRQIRRRLLWRRPP